MSTDKHRRLFKLESGAPPSPAEEAERVEREVSARIWAALLNEMGRLIAAGSVRGGPHVRERAKGPEAWSEMQTLYGEEWTTGQLYKEVANRVFTPETLTHCLSPGFMDHEHFRAHIGTDEQIAAAKAEWLEAQRARLGIGYYEVNDCGLW